MHHSQTTVRTLQIPRTTKTSHRIDTNISLKTIRYPIRNERTHARLRSKLANHLEPNEQQAKALGDSFSTTPFSHIIASPLLRAYDTARAIRSAQPESTRPELVSSPLLKEQNFGIAEGHKWSIHHQDGLSDKEHWEKGIFPVPDGRKAKFPEGESLDDLKDRATQAVKELVVPIIKDAVKEKKENVHVAVVSHGLCISETVAAVVSLDYERRSKRLEVRDRKYAGLQNTAWTRATIDLTVCTPGHRLKKLMSNKLNRMLAKLSSTRMVFLRSQSK